MERITKPNNDDIRNRAISIIRNLNAENKLSSDELSVLSAFGLIERLEYQKLKYYEDLEGQGLLTVIDNETFQRDNLDRCTHRHCNKCDKYRRDLQRYKDLEDKGRLIELPCAVGEEVWDIASMCGKRPVSHKIETLTYALFVKNLFGHRFFLTKEEAEAKLKEMEGVNE